MFRHIDLKVLARDLHKRQDSLICKNIGHVFDNYPERKGLCHDNVRLWIKDHPGDARAFGWLTDRTEEASSSRVRFVAHSIVLTAAGEYLDVTMACGEAELPFLIAQITETEFDAIAAPHSELFFIANDQQFQEFLHAQTEMLAGSWETSRD